MACLTAATAPEDHEVPDELLRLDVAGIVALVAALLALAGLMAWIATGA